MKNQAVNKKKVSLLIGMLFAGASMAVNAQTIDLNNLDDGEVYIIKKVKASDVDKKITEKKSVTNTTPAPTIKEVVVSSPTPVVVQKPQVKEVAPVERITLTNTTATIATSSSNNINNSVVSGAGNSVPLVNALKQVTPKGWLVKKDDTKSGTVNLKKSVSWSAGNGWLDTYEQIARDADLDFLINEAEKTVTVSNAASTFKAPTRSVAIFQLEGAGKPNGFVNGPSTVKEIETGGKVTIIGSRSTSTPAPTLTAVESTTLEQVALVSTPVAPVLNEKNTNSKSVAPAPIIVKEEVVKIVENDYVKKPIQVDPVPIAGQKWVLDSTKTLRENVTDWGKKAGYEVIWPGEDYRTDQRVLSGDFTSNDGPVGQLAIDYGPKSRVQKPLSFNFYQNKTLVVENWKFEQPDHYQYSRP